MKKVLMIGLVLLLSSGMALAKDYEVKKKAGDLKNMKILFKQNIFKCYLEQLRAIKGKTSDNESNVYIYSGLHKS